MDYAAKLAEHKTPRKFAVNKDFQDPPLEILVLLSLGFSTDSNG
jgi:hypothetical protein